MKRLVVFILLLAWAATLDAQIVLPESRHMAGRLDSQQSEFGDELLFGPPLGQVSPAASSFLNGWIEIRFGEPMGSKVPFTFTWNGFGTGEVLEFSGGQLYSVPDNATLANPVPFGDPQLASGGLLDLETGEVDPLGVFPIFQNTIISRVAKYNRATPRFTASFPLPELPGIPVPPFPPGFLLTDASFHADGEGNITGFEFHGLTALPAGLFSVLAPLLGFPPFAFGPQGELFFPTPDVCTEETPPSDCPSEEEAPDGYPLQPDSLFHVNLDLVTSELREVPASRPAPPCARRAVADGALAAAGGRLYHVGGTEDLLRALDRVEVYDPAAGLWQDGPTLPTAVFGAAAVALGDDVYVLGGRHSALGLPLDAVQVLDTATGSWRRVAPLALPVAEASAVSVDGRIYVLGGTTRGRFLPRITDAIQRYTPADDSWQVIAHLPYRRTRATAAVMDGEVYVVGGLDPLGRVRDDVTVFDPQNATSRQGLSLLQGVYDAVSAAFDSRLYVLGGRGDLLGSTLAEVQVLDSAVGEWRRAQPLPLPAAGMAATALDGEIFLAGGRVMTGVDLFPGFASRVFQALDISRGWRLCDTQPFVTSAGVLNAAGLAVGPDSLSPGGRAVVLGHNLAAGETTVPAGTAAPTSLGGVSVSFDGVPAPLLAVGPERLELQVPQGVTLGRARLEVFREDLPQQAPPAVVKVKDVSPGLFVVSCGEAFNARYLAGAGLWACNADGTFNYAANAVVPGSTVTLQMTGLGPTLPPVGDGEPAPEPPPEAVVLPEVTIDGLPATVLSVTLATGEIGVYDVQVVVPEGSRSASRVPVTVRVEGTEANPGVLAVGTPVTPEPLPCLRPSAAIYRTCQSAPGGSG